MGADIEGGTKPYSFIAANDDNADTIKASKGQVYCVTGINVSASLLYLKFYDQATDPDENDIPVIRQPLPASTDGAGVVFDVDVGIEFANGIAVRLVTGQDDDDATAPSAGDAVVNIFWR